MGQDLEDNVGDRENGCLEALRVKESVGQGVSGETGERSGNSRARGSNLFSNGQG